MSISYAHLTNNGSPLVTAINSFLQAQPQVQNKPKAYLNYMLVDEQFKYVSAVNNVSQSGSIPVGAAGQLTTLANNNLSIQKNGYMYIWVSNETQNWEVFFDNLSIKHTTGPLLEETHYYPFGLTMAGISTKAFGKMENKFKFNGGTEFNNSLDINQYETPHRGYDQQLGMFHQIDPLSSLNFSQSPYNFCDNNPIRFCDPLGLSKQGAGFPDDEKADESLQPVVVIGHRKDNKLTFYQADALALDAMSRGHYMFSSERARARQIDHDWHEAEGDIAEFIGWTLFTEGAGFLVGKMINGVRAWRAARAAEAARGGATFFDGALYSSKVARQMSRVDDIFHAFPRSVDGFATKFGKWSTKVGADGKTYQWLEMGGSYGGKTGTFEYIKDANEIINHRFFNIPRVP